MPIGYGGLMPTGLDRPKMGTMSISTPMSTPFSLAVAAAAAVIPGAKRGAGSAVNTTATTSGGRSLGTSTNSTADVVTAATAVAVPTLSVHGESANLEPAGPGPDEAGGGRSLVSPDQPDLLEDPLGGNNGGRNSDGDGGVGRMIISAQGVTETVWQVGCYKINPSTPRGQKLFILHMLVLPLIPITALVIQNSVTMNSLLGYQARVSSIRRQVQGAMEIAVFIQNIQEERAEVALYIFTKQTNLTAYLNTTKNDDKNRMGLTQRFQQTDKALLEVPTWPNLHDTSVDETEDTAVFKSKLKFQIQHEVFRVKVREGSFEEITSILAWYEFINNVILDHLDDEIKSTNKSGVWRYLISFKNLLRAIENIGIVSVYGIKYLTTGNVTQENFIKYVEHDTLIWEYLNSSIHLAPYLEEKFQKIYEQDAYQFYRASDKQILSNALDVKKGSSNISNAMLYFNSISEYMLQLRQVLEELRDDIEHVAQDELNSADKEKIIGIAILSFISLITVIFYFFVRNALSIIRVFAKEVMVTVRELEAEKTKFEKAFNDFLPKSIVEELKEKKVLAEKFDSVTVFYGDILGLNQLSNGYTPSELLDFINGFCTALDARMSKFDVSAIQTIGNDFMVVSGLPSKVGAAGAQHVLEIATMSLDLLALCEEFTIPHRPNTRIHLRMGFHTGPVVGVVAGCKIPNYCVMGDTVEIARSVEVMGEPMKINVSEASKQLLDDYGGFRLEYRGFIDLSPRYQQIETYFLVGKG